MKFTAVIGNPPYQGFNNHERLYPDFYLSAINMGDNVCLIFPTRWQEPKNANGLNKLNKKEIKTDKQIVYIDNMHNVFPGVNGADWTNIIVWKKDYDNGYEGLQKVLTNHTDAKIKKIIWDKNEIEKPTELINLEKIVIANDNFRSIQNITSNSKPYGLRTDAIKNAAKYGIVDFHDTKKDGDIKVYGNKIISYLPNDFRFIREPKGLGRYKVFIPNAWGGSITVENGYKTPFADIILALPNEACTETYIESGYFDSLEVAKKHAKYLLTKFSRALLLSNKYSILCGNAWSAVPIQDYTESWWNKTIQEIDEELFKKYDIPEDTRQFVRNNIQTRSEENIVNYSVNDRD